MSSPETAKGWCVLELMGHRKLAGFLTDDDGLVRIDVYLEDPDLEDERLPIATQWYGRHAVYCITASTKELCLQLAAAHQPQPVGRWELPERAESTSIEADDVDEADEEFPY